MKKFWLSVILITLHLFVFAQLQSVSIIADNTGICEGGYIQFNLKIEMVGTPNLKVKWTPDYCISSDAVANPVVSPLQNTTYKVVVTDIDNSISKSASIPITVVAQPVVTAPLSGTYCANTSVELSPLKFDNAKSPKWAHNGKGSFIYTKDSLQVTYVPYTNETGDITITLTGKSMGYCNDASDITTITYEPETIARILNSETIICSNTTLQISGETENCNSFSWSHNGDGDLLNTNTLSPVYVPEQQERGNVDITLTAYGAGCNDSGIYSFMVGVSPEVELPPDDTVCANNPFTVKPEVYKNILSSQWAHDGKGELVYSKNLSSATYVPAEDELGDIKVTITSISSDNCGEVSDIIILTYVPAAIARILNKDTLICSNSTLPISGETENCDHFSWSYNGDGKLLYPNTLNPVYVPGDRELGDVDVILTAFRTGCEYSDTLLVIVGESPEIQLPPNDTACSNNPFAIVPEVYENIHTSEWQHTGKGSFIYSKNLSSATYAPAENELGSIMVTVTGQSPDNCGEVSDTMYIYYTEATYASIEKPVQVLCSNKSIQLKGSAGNYSSLKWRHNGDGELTGSKTLSPVYTPDVKESGKVQFILYAYGPYCDCSDTVEIRVSQMYIELAQNTSACEGDKVMLSIFSSSDYSYLWNTGETGNSISVDAEYSTTYSVVATNSDQCTAQADIQFEVIESPALSFSSDTENKILYVSPEGLKRYEFYDQDGTLLYAGELSYFDYSSAFYGTRSITIIGYNDSGCASDEEASVYIIPKMLKVNVFSPNGDGINDLLMQGRRITVFDRSDKILYEGWDGWDGTYNGRKMAQGTYFYILYDGNDVYYKGPVTIVR